MAEGPTLSEEQSVDLIDKLATNDTFRAELINDPAGTLLSYYQVTVDPDHIPDEVLLPGKQEIADNMHDYVSKVNTSLQCKKRFKFTLDEEST